jgi:hypothetical protein
MSQKTILITGASIELGRLTAEALDRAWHAAYDSAEIMPPETDASGVAEVIVEVVDTPFGRRKMHQHRELDPLVEPRPSRTKDVGDHEHLSRNHQRDGTHGEAEDQHRAADALEQRDEERDGGGERKAENVLNEARGRRHRVGHGAVRCSQELGQPVRNHHDAEARSQQGVADLLAASIDTAEGGSDETVSSFALRIERISVGVGLHLGS